MNLFQRSAAVFNLAVKPLVNAPIVGPLLGNQITVITYVGRKSGKTFSAPMGYKRAGDTVTILAAFPERKGWWRNFYPDGGPITLTLDGRDRSGHAVASKDGSTVRVTVELSQ